MTPALVTLVHGLQRAWAAAGPYLRWINVAVWTGTLLYMLPGALVATFGHARRDDPMRLARAATAVMFIGFNLFYLLFPQQQSLLNMLLIVSTMLALYIIALGRANGRGPHV